MIFGKKLGLVITLFIMSCANASAMKSMKFWLDKPIDYFPKTRAFAQISRSFSSRTINQQERNHTADMGEYKTVNKILETPIIAKGRPPSYNLPKDFFIEDREGVIVNYVNERILHVHRNIKMEKECYFNNIEENNHKEKHFALFKEENGKIIDQRTRIKDPLSPQYLPICHLHGSYKLSEKDLLTYRGSGFRNSLNQIITAGHTLFIDEKYIKKYYKKKKLSPPNEKFSFEKERLTMEIIFGYLYENGETKYSHICKVNGVHCFTKKGRDLGIIQLPTNQKELLDNNIGSLPTKLFPDQPHEYMGKHITIVGYPGEIKTPFLYSHSGPIKNVDPSRIVFYEVDTTKGNSGSPGFPEINNIESNTEIIPAFLTHTHGIRKSKINAGEGYDQDFYDFMRTHTLIDIEKE